MRAGRLDREIIIEKRAVGTNPLGEETETWAALVTVSADVVRQPGRESFNAQQIIAQQTVLFRIHWRTDVNPKDNRISYDGRLYDITSVNEIRRRVGLEVLTTVQGL